MEAYIWDSEKCVYVMLNSKDRYIIYKEFHSSINKSINYRQNKFEVKIDIYKEKCSFGKIIHNTLEDNSGILRIDTRFFIMNESGIIDFLPKNFSQPFLNLDNGIEPHFWILNNLDLQAYNEYMNLYKNIKKEALEKAFEYLLENNKGIKEYIRLKVMYKIKKFTGEFKKFILNEYRKKKYINENSLSLILDPNRYIVSKFVCKIEFYKAILAFVETALSPDNISNYQFLLDGFIFRLPEEKEEATGYVLDRDSPSASLMFMERENLKYSGNQLHQIASELEKAGHEFIDISLLPLDEEDCNLINGTKYEFLRRNGID